MAKKKQLDKLSQEMIQCEKDGFSVHYGRWKATQPIVKPVPVDLPEGWRVCPHCGREFKPVKGNNKYCGAECCREANQKRWSMKRATYLKEYKARKKAEMEALL